MADRRQRALARDPQADPARVLTARLRAGERCGEPGVACYMVGTHARDHLRAGRGACPVCAGTLLVHPRDCPRCAGLSLRERIELAAYCGSEAARLAADHPYPTPPVLRDWLTGLTRWGTPTLVRAARAAAEVPMAIAEAACGPDCDCGGWRGVQQQRRALSAVDAWLECPCEEHRQACYELMLSIGLLDRDPILWALLDMVGSNAPESTASTVAVHATRLTSEPAVREAIQRALCEWALREGT